MKDRNWIIILIATFVVLMIGGLTLAACTGSFRSSNNVVQEGEDCDAEDFMNREDDCGFSDKNRKSPSARTKPTKTVTKPAPARTANTRATPQRTR